MTKHRRRTRVLRRLALGLAVAVVAVPSAQAQIHEREGLDAGGANAKSVTDYPSDAAAAAIQGNGSVRSITDYPSDVAAAAARSYGPLFQGQASADISVPAARAWPGVSPTFVPYEPAPTAVVSSPGGFDWGDAGIGAGMLLAFTLLGAGALVATRHVGGHATA